MTVKAGTYHVHAGKTVNAGPADGAALTVNVRSARPVPTAPAAVRGKMMAPVVSEKQQNNAPVTVHATFIINTAARPAITAAITVHDVHQTGTARWAAHPLPIVISHPAMTTVDCFRFQPTAITKIDIKALRGFSSFWVWAVAKCAPIHAPYQLPNQNFQCPEHNAGAHHDTGRQRPA